jgi:hypothetical protein
LYCLSSHLRLLSTSLISLNSSYQTQDLKFKFLEIQNNKCYVDRWAGNCKKRLKTPKEQSESLHQRITDNTMAKRNSAIGQTMIYWTYT